MVEKGQSTPLPIWHRNLHVECSYFITHLRLSLVPFIQGPRSCKSSLACKAILLSESIETRIHTWQQDWRPGGPFQTLFEHFWQAGQGPSNCFEPRLPARICRSVRCVLLHGCDTPDWILRDKNLQDLGLGIIGMRVVRCLDYLVRTRMRVVHQGCIAQQHCPLICGGHLPLPLHLATYHLNHVEACRHIRLPHDIWLH